MGPSLTQKLEVTERRPSMAKRDNRYWPSLDGIRGLAVMAVVLFHASRSVPGGFLGVDVFFVLSGFLITTLLLDERDRFGSISLARFYARRLLRLYPALILTCLFGLILIFIAPAALESREDSLRAIPLSLLYVSNLVDGSLGVFGHTWSLSLEEQFYLVWPMSLIAILWAMRNKARVLPLVLAAVLLTVIWRAALWESGAPENRILYLLDTHGEGFLLGCGLAIAASSALIPMGERATQLYGYLAWLGLGAITGMALFQSDHEWLVGGGSSFVVAVATTCLILGALWGRSKSLTQLLNTRPLLVTGRVSYGIYLFHPFVIGALEALGLSIDSPLFAASVVVASSVLALISYTFLERPFLRIKERFRRTPASPYI